MEKKKCIDLNKYLPKDHPYAKPSRPDSMELLMELNAQHDDMKHTECVDISEKRKLSSTTLIDLPKLIGVPECEEESSGSLEDAEFERINELQLQWEKIQPDRTMTKEHRKYYSKIFSEEMYDILNELWPISSI